jgi:hypothetical protein
LGKKIINFVNVYTIGDKKHDGNLTLSLRRGRPAN